jgi:hypothetical protein
MSGVEDSLARAKAVIAGDAHMGGPGGTVGLLRRVCQAALWTLAGSGAGVAVMTGDGVRGVGAASDPAAERVEELQFTLGEGPCIDAYTLRCRVLVPDLTDGAMTQFRYQLVARSGSLRQRPRVRWGPHQFIRSPYSG